MSLPALEKDREFTLRFADDIARKVERFEIYPAEQSLLRDETSIGELRRSRRSRFSDPVGNMSLIETDGILHWEFGVGAAPANLRRGRRSNRQRDTVDHRIIRQFKFADLPPNKIGQKLTELDERLTPRQGLRRVGKNFQLGREERPLKSGKILLFVHGTFSSVDSMLEEIRHTQHGVNFLREVAFSSQYDQVLGFNHPTLSVSPILNAASLAKEFRGSSAQVDVVCHSRGGLVVRWWLEALDHLSKPRGRVVFVGSPLAGTALASPSNLKDALNLLTNYARGMSYAAKGTKYVFPVAAPLSEAVGVLFSITGKIMSLAASTPILDAGISMIPGLSAQSREGANGELLRLRESYEGYESKYTEARFQRNYSFIRSNFETENPDWKFWKYFRKIGERVVDSVTDTVFQSENDLVVDSVSMTSLSDGSDSRKNTSAPNRESLWDFGTSDEVHHCNYFQQSETFDFLRDRLSRPFS